MERCPEFRGSKVRGGGGGGGDESLSLGEGGC